MTLRSKLLLNILALVILGLGITALLEIAAPANTFVAPVGLVATTSLEEISAASPVTAASTTLSAPSSNPKTKIATTPVAKVTKKSATQQVAGAAAPSSATTSTGQGGSQAARIQNPYPFEPESSDAVNSAARAALVNILCTSRGSIHPISASGVVIDPRGVILTNAHVAQYILLSEDQGVSLSCEVRTGSPAHPSWTAQVLYMPPVWVAAHASELNTPDPTGTGEHDYALLLITGSADAAPLPGPPAGGFPSVPYDTRNATGFAGEQVLVASYPAEFLGGIQALNGLYAVSSVITIGQLLTFSQGSVDVFSLGGVIEAQSGSSGGAVVNPWGRLIGLITTTSEGATTVERDLHALTLSYINGDIKTQSGSDLSTMLAGDLQAKLSDFNAHVFPDLFAQFAKQIKPAQ